MRKLSFLGVILLSLTFILGGCKKDVETSKLIIDLENKSTITIHAYAELNYTTDGLENAPDGTEIYLRISKQEFNKNAEANTYWETTASVKDGKIQVEVPATERGVKVEVFPFNFTTSQKQIDGTSKPKIYRNPGEVLNSVKIGENRIHQLIYNFYDFENISEVTATIVVYAYAELDYTTDGYEKVPNGTQIMLQIDKNDPFNNADEDWSEIFSVKDGKIEGRVPATDKGVTVKIIPFEFIAKQVQPYGSISTEITKIFSFAGVPTISIKAGEIKTHQLPAYSASGLTGTNETVKRNFKLMADFDETSSTDSEVPNKTSVTFYSDEWAETVEINNNDGHVSIELPVGHSINIRFEASKRVYVDPLIPTSTLKNHLYETWAIGSPYNSVNPVRIEINFGGGSLWE
jgi:hypothetical protein